MPDDSYRRARAAEPATKRVYQYESFQVARHFGLTYSEWPILLSLCLLANRWTGRYEGTYSDLGDDTLANYRTIVSAIDRLAKVGAVEVLHPFTRGHAGAVLILVYANLIVVPTKYVGPAPLLLDSRAALADVQEDTADDQPFRETSRTKDARREQGSTGESRDRVVCACGNEPEWFEKGVPYCIGCTPF